MDRAVADNAFVAVAGLAGHVAFDEFMAGIHFERDSRIVTESPDFTAFPRRWT